MSSAIQIYKKNPTLGEQRTSLINSSDGAGLNLQSGGNIEIANGAAQFGTSDFSIEFILNQEKENASESYIYVTHTSGHNRLLIFHDVSDDNLVLDFRNASSASTKKDLAYDMNQDFGSPTHYVITFDRSGLATLYKNGNSVASVDISALSAIDIGTDSSGSRIGTGSTDGVIGTFYRFRTWNKLVDAKALFERADVDYSSQYGSQSELVTNGTFAADSNWTKSTGWSITGGAAVATSAGSGVQIYQTVSGLTVGKKYRLSFEVSAFTSGSVKAYAISTTYSTSTLSATGSATVEFTATGTAHLVSVITQSASTSLSVDNVSVVQIGCVSDYQTQWANPSQSLTVQDASGAADGTCSASGVTQVQPVVQLNSTSARIGTSALQPADGELVVDKVDVRNGNVRVIGGNQVQLLNAANDTNVDIINSGGTGVAQLGLRVAGAEKVTIDSSGTVSITNATSTDIGDLSNATQLYLENSTANKPVGITFGASNAAGGPSGTGTSSARMCALASGAVGVFDADLVFETRSGSAIAERMRIASSGAVSIPSASGNQIALTVKGGNNLVDNIALNITNQAGDSGTNIRNNGQLFASTLATFSGGIAFGQTNSAVAGVSDDSTTLNHYESGAWSPTVFKGSTQHTGASVYGKYVRIGNLVWISFYILKSSGTESASGTWTVKGLPFPVKEGTAAGYQSISSNYFNLNGVNYFNASPHRWQINATDGLTLYGTHYATTWSSGAMEFAGSGVLHIDY